MQREFKGIWIPKEVYLSKDVCWTAKIIFLEIDSFTAQGKACFFSNEYLAELLGVSTTQISKHISRLIDLGWIEQTSFDGRKRYLQGCLVTDFKADFNFSSRQPTIGVQSSPELEFNHNNTVNNTANSTYGEGQSLPLEVGKEAIPPPTKKSRKTNLKKLFKDSQFKDLKYTVEYFQGTDLAQVNWKHYLPKIEAWSEKKGVKRDEQGWRDTIETWITKDINTNSLRTVRDIHPDNGTVENPKTLKGDAYFDYYGGLNPNFKQPDQ